MVYQPRTYRNTITNVDLTRFRVVVRETDLFISAETDLSAQADILAQKYYDQVDDYIKSQPAFGTSLEPLDVSTGAPLIIKDMVFAGKRAGVGPMAAVAGSISEYVGRELLNNSNEVIIENGGDIFIKSSKERNIMIYAGQSKLSNRIGLRLKPDQTPCGIATSSGTVGHSLSFGQADAVMVKSESTPMADAFATSICNQVKTEDDIPKALAQAQDNSGYIQGVIIILKDKLGTWGDIELLKVFS